MAPSTAVSTSGDTDKQIFIGKGEHEAWLNFWRLEIAMALSPAQREPVRLYRYR